MSERKRAKTSGTPASIREAMKKATTEMLVLFVLQQKSMYTYEMMQAIERMSEGKITFNTLYQAIYRLQDFHYIQEKGKVVSEDNRIRIYFSITDAGKVYLQQLIAEYRSFTGAVNLILETGEQFLAEAPEPENIKAI
ncbi:MAG: PadR family transcriptional regulator [Evtepia sp.]|uniref:PadR family transcriptional regulator n=1 Tax=Evtepia sp. TaxID=2773933 RepID=UPI002A755486|nr:PadR family transcriptional regulator [Evtepia sp.]MDY3014353.1 PadR family transcriptional regulator [Evtepia sp.]